MNTLLDMRDRDSARIKALEGQLGVAVSVIEALQKRMDSMDTQVELAKSDALAEQQVELAQMTVNLQAIGAEQEANHQRRLEEAQAQATEHRGRMEARERVLGDMEGRLKSSGQLFQERSNAVVDQLASTENRLAKAQVSQTEIDDGIRRNRDWSKDLILLKVDIH